MKNTTMIRYTFGVHRKVCMEFVKFVVRTRERRILVIAQEHGKSPGCPGII